MRSVWQVECEALPGLEDLLGREIERRLGAARSPGFRFSGPLAELLQLRIAHSVYLVVAVRGARPTALLGHENLRRLLAAIDATRSLHPPGAFRSFRFSAAGSDSSTFRRLAAALEEATSLPQEPETGDLLLRVRRTRDGWETLVRLSARPLSARAWRLRNLPGALNAGIAAAMVELTGPRPGDRFANLACGSGTLLAERLLRCPAEEALGYEIEAAPLEAARANLAAAGVVREVVLVRADVTTLPRRDSSLDAMVVDLPYGDLMGSHAANSALYRPLLVEAARVAAAGARLVVITQEVRLLESCLAESGSPWSVERRLRVLQGGHQPLVVVLRRRPK
ncbi:MAG TPA: methyltransferase domain-containing protein [Candidatus Dormibacteraeota bacterium]